MIRSRSILVILLAVIIILISAGCGSSSAGGGAEKAVAGYLEALVAQDGDAVSNISCSDWEAVAILEMDSFQAVNPRLEGMTCSQTGEDGDVALVLCEGKIIATYGDEEQELDLNLRTYQVVNQGGEWLVCGYR